MWKSRLGRLGVSDRSIGPSCTCACATMRRVRVPTIDSAVLPPRRRVDSVCAAEEHDDVTTRRNLCRTSRKQAPSRPLGCCHVGRRIGCRVHPLREPLTIKAVPEGQHAWRDSEPSSLTGTAPSYSTSLDTYSIYSYKGEKRRARSRPVSLTPTVVFDQSRHIFHPQR